MTPRPYLQNFLSYLFHPSVSATAMPGSQDCSSDAASVTSDGSNNGYEVMVWSSAQPHSVERMVNRMFGEHKESMLAIWDRTRLELTPKQYSQYILSYHLSQTDQNNLQDMKVPTVKDLRKVWTEYPRHSAHTTILLDDSVDKAQLQSDNHICVSKYTVESHTKDTREHKLSLITKNEPIYDQMLVGVIGILEELRNKDSVSDWLHAGGLRRTDASVDGPPLEQEEGGGIWFDDQKLLAHWIERGRLALEKLQISMDAGMTSN